MPSASHPNEFVLHSMSLELFGHQNRLLKRNVCVLVSVKKHGGRITLSNISEGTERIKSSWFLVWIRPDYFHWPNALLTCEKIESASVGGQIVGNEPRPDCSIGLFPRDRRLTVIERVRPTIPFPGNVTVAVKGYDCRGSGMQSVGRRQRQIAPCRMSDDGDAVRINPKQLWTFAAHPSICIFKILEYLTQLGLRRQPIVDRNDRIASVEVSFSLGSGQPSPVSHDQRATMDPEDGRPDNVIRLSVDICTDAKISTGLVSVCTSPDLLSFLCLKASHGQYQGNCQP